MDLVEHLAELRRRILVCLMATVAGSALGYAVSPQVLEVLARAGVIACRTMRKNRGYVIVGTFCLAAVLTPADVFSQIALAIPLIILFEMSTMIAWLVRREPLNTADRESRG
ncbi:MAG: twin-arginine translocase subunit TatC [Bacillota bacterium]|nr:twin-arginine translocase subunit TatC [Bacillota bacterium]